MEAVVGVLDEEVLKDAIALPILKVEVVVLANILGKGIEEGNRKKLIGTQRKL